MFFYSQCVTSINFEICKSWIWLLLIRIRSFLYWHSLLLPLKPTGQFPPGAFSITRKLSPPTLRILSYAPKFLIPISLRLIWPIVHPKHSICPPNIPVTPVRQRQQMHIQPGMQGLLYVGSGAPRPEPRNIRAWLRRWRSPRHHHRCSGRDPRSLTKLVHLNLSSRCL